MAAKSAAEKEPDQAPSPAELARLYLDLWEKNLCLQARDGTPVEPAAGPPPARPG